MATVDKLLIKGIRSFSPNNETVIEFYKPLTLIVGPNGAGKTTVIECLKMATTGEMPPHSRSGQAFVMDPKVAGEAEVKAQIKLRFKSVSGKSVVVCRSFQLTEKKGRNQLMKQEFKTLDSTLQSTNAQGQRVTLTHRCADLDRQVPELMGVSKAILENVVFCHQDDSNWPLDDPKTLKVKFDDIFAATKYTKALEAIRAFRAKQAGAVKEYEAQLAVLHTNKEQATKLRESMGRESRAVHELGVKMREAERNLEGKRQRVAALREAIRTVDELQGQVAQLATRRAALEEERVRLLGDVGELLSDAPEELEAYRSEFASNVDAMKRAIEAKERRVRAARVELEALQGTHTQLCAQQGKLAGELETHRRTVRERDRAIASVASKHSLNPGFVGEAFDEGTVRAFAARVESHAAQLRADLDARRRAAAAEDAKRAEALEALRVKLGAAREALSLKEANRRDGQRAEAALRTELGGLDVSEARVAEAVAAEATAEGAVKRERERAAASGVEQQMREAEERVREAQAARGRLQDEVKALRYQADAAVKLDVKRHERDARRAQADALLEGRRAALERLLGGAAIVPERVDAAAREAARRLAEKLAGEEARMRDAQRRLELTRGRLDAATAALDGLLQQRSERRAMVTAAAARAGAEGGVPEIIRTTEAAAAARRRDLVTADGLTGMFARFREEGSRRKCCPVCERDFKAAAELDDFLTLMEERVAASPEITASLRREVDRLEAEYRAARELEPAWLELQRLEEEVPRAEAEAERVRAEVGALEAEANELAARHAVALHNEREGREAALVAEKVAGLVREHAELARAVREEEARLAGPAGARSFDAARTELDAAEEHLTQLVRRREQLQKEREAAASALRAAENGWREARERRLKLEGVMESHARVSRLLQEAGERDQALAHDIAELSRALEPLRREVEAAQKAREETQRAGQRSEREAAEKLSAFESDLTPYTTAARLIHAFVAGRREEAAAEAAGKVRAALEQLEAGRGRLQQVEEELLADRKQAAEQETILRNVVDNLRLRELVAKVAEVDAAVAQKTAERDSVVGYGQAAGALETEERELAEQNNKLGQLSGAESALRKKLREYREELNSPKYINIDEDYRRMQIRLRTTAMANGDLDKFHGALDRALMKFHALKMEEINRIVKDTWAITYRGHDIDTIAIRSNVDEGEGGAAAGGRGQRNYNYRVVMVKGGVELDMRGRCSAGQKVLASLIIRLALAEVFGLQCGILALDEPTTNLDAANMESFAAALQNIVKSRSSQVNFQLVVITHDEEFVRLLGQRELVEHYYRIAKDESAFTAVAQQSIDAL